MKVRILRKLLSSHARPLRFAGTGVTAGAIQLVLLTFLSGKGWDTLAANAVAFAIAAQVNFLLSTTVTWRDRALPGSLLRRWALFHCSIALMAVVNMLTFAVARTAMPIVAASLAGIAMAALGNYLIGDRIVFSRRAGSSSFLTTSTPAA